MTEIWKPVVGYEGKYEVSDAGRIRTFSYNAKTPFMRARASHNGYLRVSLWDGAKYRSQMIHRIVAAAFLGQIQEGQQVNHINGGKTDNAPMNLEYCTPSENRKHAFKIGLQSNLGEKHSQAKLNEFKVKLIRKLLRVGYSNKRVAAIMHVTSTAISDVKSGKRWSHVR